MPCFLGSVMSTQDKMAFVLLMVNLAVSYVIWAPFISAYERRLAHDAEKAVAEPSSEPLSQASDEEEPK